MNRPIDIQDTSPSLGAPVASWLSARLKGLGQLSLPLFGFAFARAWNDVAFVRLAELGGPSVWLGQDMLSIAMTLVFVAGIVFARRIAPLCGRIWPRVTAVAAMVAVSPVLCLVSGELPVWLLAVVAASAGVGGALSVLLWAELQSCFNSYRIVLYVSGGFLLGAALGWVIEGLDGVRLLVALIALASCSLWCLGRGYREVPACDMPVPSRGAVRFPWQLVVVLGIYQLVLGIQEATSSSSSSAGLFTLSVVLSAAALIVVAVCFSRWFDYTLLFKTPFAFMACGVVATILSVAGTGALADFLISFGYGTMFLLLTILMCDVSHRYGISVLVLCGIKELGSLAMVVGHWLGVAMQVGRVPVGSDDPLVRAALFVAILAASLLLLFGNKMYAKWGVSFFGVDRLAGEQGVRDVFIARCQEIASAHGLSPRESEILQLYALGKTPPSIERELCIAAGTLKSHTRRIYQKLGVHSRDELRQITGEPPA